jgi:ribosomal protein S12 methylthiotransferase
MVKIYPVSLGCPKNQSVLEERLDMLRGMGHEVVSDPAIADVAIVNTCTFIAPATVESVETTVSLKEQYPHLKVVFTGCVVQRYGKEAIHKEIPEVDIILDPDNLEEWNDIFWQFPRGEELDADEYPRIPFTLTFPYAYVYIAKGCSSSCSYCTIPSFKGPQRSIDIDVIVNKVKKLENAGYKEVVLVAQDVAAYGIETGKKKLPELLKALHDNTKEVLFRLLYLNPKYFRNDLMKQISVFDRLVPYFDIPVQHLHTDVLKLMNRGYGYHEIESILDSVYQYWKDPAIRTTLMVGFPGETEEHFYFMKERITTLPFDWIGVFQFVPEEGTTAYDMPQISDDIKQRRHDELVDVVSKYVDKRAMRWVGKNSQAIVTEVISRDSGEVLDIGYPMFCAPEIDKIIEITNGDVGDIGQVVDVYIEDYRDDVYVARIR